MIIIPAKIYASLTANKEATKASVPLFKLNHQFASFTVGQMTWFDVREYMCHKSPRICSTCRKYFLILLSSFITYHRVCNQINRKAAMCDVCRSLYVLLCFSFLAILLSILLRYTDSDYQYPFVIIKLFFLAFFFQLFHGENIVDDIMTMNTLYQISTLIKLI